MRHAYLILAHTEFDVLERLLASLDDERNDIFIHYDLKLKYVPSFQLTKARLFLIDERIDVRWGDVSVIMAEYALFEAAKKNNSDYIYYHLLSGVDMPLHSQDFIHQFFKHMYPKQFIGYNHNITKKEINRRVNKYHIFPKSFRSRKGFLTNLKRILRVIILKLQEIVGVDRNGEVDFKKGTQWVSVTQGFVNLIIDKKKETLSLYANSFCSDEFFVQTLCWNSEFRLQIYNYNNEGLGSMRKINWIEGNLIDWNNADYEQLMPSEYIFARKFNGQNIDIVDRILKKTNDTK